MKRDSERPGGTAEPRTCSVEGCTGLSLLTLAPPSSPERKCTRGLGQRASGGTGTAAVDSRGCRGAPLLSVVLPAPGTLLCPGLPLSGGLSHCGNPALGRPSLDFMWCCTGPDLSVFHRLTILDFLSQRQLLLCSCRRELCPSDPRALVLPCRCPTPKTEL